MSIREYIIRERNWLDAVIGLPANIFYGTSIPTCILVFKKCREYPDDILFMDASNCSEKARNKNLLRAVDIDRIVGTYQRRAVEARFSHWASLAEVAENDYNLNIPRHVDTLEPEEPVDLAAVTRDLKATEAGMRDKTARKKKLVFDLPGTERQLRSKRELIERFIEQHMPKAPRGDSVDGAFYEYWDAEHRKAMERICSEEDLKQEAFLAMIESYRFSGKPPRNDAVVGALETKPKILERKSEAEQIVQRPLGLIATFEDGMGGHQGLLHFFGPGKFCKRPARWQNTLERVAFARSGE